MSDGKTLTRRSPMDYDEKVAAYEAKVEMLAAAICGKDYEGRTGEWWRTRARRALKALGEEMPREGHPTREMLDAAMVGWGRGGSERSDTDARHDMKEALLAAGEANPIMQAAVEWTRVWHHYNEYSGERRAAARRRVFDAVKDAGLLDA